MLMRPYECGEWEEMVEIKQREKCENSHNQPEVDIDGSTWVKDFKRITTSNNTTVAISNNNWNLEFRSVYEIINNNLKNNFLLLPNKYQISQPKRLVDANIYQHN